MQKTKSYLKNPTAIFSFLTVVFSLIMLIGTHFQLPDFYTDREAAYLTAQSVNPGEVWDAVKKYENLGYKIYNVIFQLWGWWVILFLICAFCRIKSFEDFGDIRLLKSRTFIYFWINISYLIYSFCFVPAYMLELNQHVYNNHADSMGIPFFGEILCLLFFSFIYYPSINLMFFIAYNTKIKGKFYSFVFSLGLLYILWNIFVSFLMRFTYWHFGINLFNIVWLALILYSLRHFKKKREGSDNKFVDDHSECNQPNEHDGCEQNGLET